MLSAAAKQTHHDFMQDYLNLISVGKFNVICDHCLSYVCKLPKVYAQLVLMCCLLYLEIYIYAQLSWVHKVQTLSLLYIDKQLLSLV